MALAFVKNNQANAATQVVTPAFGSATTAGNLLCLAISADNNLSSISTWTQSAEMEQLDFMGAYLLWRISAGETTLDTYTVNGGAFPSAWAAAEFSGNDAAPYDISEGQHDTGSIGANFANYTTANITPTTGQRLLVAAVAGHDHNSDQTGVYTSWLNSFTRIEDSGQNANPCTCIGIAYRIVTGDNATAFSTGATFPNTLNSRASMIISFKEAAAAGGDHPAVKRMGGVPHAHRLGRNVWSPIMRQASSIIKRPPIIPARRPLLVPGWCPAPAR